MTDGTTDTTLAGWVVLRCPNCRQVLEGFDGPALEAVPEVKVVALTKAVELYLEHFAANEPATMYKQVVDGARQFEAYLTGEPSKEG